MDTLARWSRFALATLIAFVYPIRMRTPDSFGPASNWDHPPTCLGGCRARHGRAVRFGVVLALIAAGDVAVRGAGELAVLAKPPAGAAAKSMLGEYLQQRARAALDVRDAAYAKIGTPEQLREWQCSRRERFLGAIGEFPPRTPLNARVAGQRAFSDYRIEKILFESQPGFFVTATLYLPLTPGPHPAVLHPTGHSPAAKARDLYQRASIYLARNGIACLCYDPVGQGERRQLFDAAGRPLPSTTQEHQIMGVGSTLLGTSLARTMIWDGMRAIDYLQSRPDIDRTRLGCMGISGGGTMTSYLGALDERIAVSAPGCYLTGFRSLLDTIGPQDIEQNLFNQLGNGLDQVDYVLMRAPRPTLIMAATRDFFAIGGTWQLFRESKRAYGRLGFAERVDLNEADTEHTYSLQHCVAGVRWFGRWFLGREPLVPAEDLPVLPEKELACTPDGQVLRMPGARSLFDLQGEEESALAPRRQQRVWRAAGLRPAGSRRLDSGGQNHACGTGALIKMDSEDRRRIKRSDIRGVSHNRRFVVAIFGFAEGRFSNRPNAFRNWLHDRCHRSWTVGKPLLLADAVLLCRVGARALPGCTDLLARLPGGRPV